MKKKYVLVSVVLLLMVVSIIDAFNGMLNLAVAVMLAANTLAKIANVYRK